MFTLPDLPYDFNALEPYIDARTMEIHYKEHHAAYLRNFNQVIFDTVLEQQTPMEIFAEVSKHPPSIRNYGGGVFNHALFWKVLTPATSGLMDIQLADAVTKYFGTIDNMKEEFSAVAASHFGSGWTWLVKKDDGELLITSTANQDTPLMDTSAFQGNPILCLDLWEHAYYLQYQNRKPDYIQAFWRLVNWDQVAKFYKNET